MYQQPGGPIVFKAKGHGNAPPPAATSVLSQAVMTLKLQPEENIQAASRMTITASLHSKASRQSPRWALSGNHCNMPAYGTPEPRDYSPP